MTALVSVLFISMIPIDCKITNFSYTFLFTFSSRLCINVVMLCLLGVSRDFLAKL